MKFFYTIGFSMFFLMPTLAQQTKVDSLKAMLNRHTNNDTLKVATLLNLSFAINMIDSDSALVYANSALDLSNTLNWAKGMALSYRQKGLVLYYKSDYLNALQFSQNALIQAEPLGNKLLDASIYNNIGNIYADIGDLEKALTNYQRFLEIAKIQKSVSDELTALTNIATIHVEQQNYTNAVTEFLQCLDLANKNGISAYVSIICNNLSKTYQYLQDDKKAIYYLNLGIEKAKATDNQYNLSVLLRNLGGIYLKKGETTAAEKALLESISAAKSSNTIDWEAESLKLLSSVYEKQNKNDQALSTYKNYIVLRDSILNEEKKSELIKKDLTFENQKNQALAQAEIKRQKLIKNGSIAGGSVLLLMSIFALVIYKRKRDAVAQKQEAEFKTTVADTELKALRAQMNPHFIFNSLNSINDYIQKNDVAAASDYLTKFAKIIRQALESSSQKQITLSEDLKLIELYLQIECMRLKQKFSYAISIDDAIDADNILVPPLILQPFIENSIWHGISKKEGKGHIQIDIKQKDGMLLCSIDDDGVGRIKTDLINENKSLGMTITKNRIDIINRNKDTNDSITLTDKAQGLRVEVKLPIHYLF
ncbi:MAG: tetratricopeptide repeat protein [Gelidibacter sp.]